MRHIVKAWLVYINACNKLGFVIESRNVIELICLRVVNDRDIDQFL